MTSVKLTPRLKLVSSFVEKGSVFVDVGTDHAYLPIYLCENKISRYGTASDINSGPLEIARRNLGLAGLLDKVSLVLSDGLNNVDTDKLDTVIIAGMGGETIAGILEQSNLNNTHNIILQPMTQVSALRGFLAKNGYEIVSEALAEEENKIYHVLQVRKNLATIDLNDNELYVGSKYQNKNDCTYRKFLEKELSRLEKIISGMECAKNTDEDELLKVKKEKDAFARAKEEIS